MTRHATLIYNAKAGSSATASPELISEQLHRMGYQPVYAATDSEEDLKDALQHIQNTVFVAGGDGTLRAAAQYLVGREVTLGILPMGTANNVARALGLEGSVMEVLESYEHAHTAAFDVGRVKAPWGHEVFLEACGCGVFAEILAQYDPQEGKNPLRAMHALGSVALSWEGEATGLVIDAEKQPPAAYALLELMNTKATGPRLNLATEADPHDGLLELVTIDEGEREGILKYFTALVTNTFSELQSVQTRRVRSVTISPYLGQAVHVDGEVRGGAQWIGGQIDIEVWIGALQVFLPSSQASEVTS